MPRTNIKGPGIAFGNGHCNYAQDQGKQANMRTIIVRAMRRAQLLKINLGHISSLRFQNARKEERNSGSHAGTGK